MTDEQWNKEFDRRVIAAGIDCLDMFELDDGQRREVLDRIQGDLPDSINDAFYDGINGAVQQWVEDARNA